MIDAVLADGSKYSCGIDFAQTDMGATRCRDCPGETPSVGVKHRQGPEIHRPARHAPINQLEHAHKIDPTVTDYDPFRVGGRAGRVVQRDSFPFVRGPYAFEVWITLSKQLLIVELTD